MVESITVTITTTTSNSRRQMHGILFAEKFKEYHDSHAHDGEAPRFEFIKAADVRDVYAGGRNHNHGEITIDGYAFYEIKEYHNRETPGHVHALPCADVLYLTDYRLG